MTEATMTIQQLGAQVKAKYPAYAQYSDDEVGQRTLTKYPVYQSRITAEAPAPAPSAFGNRAKDIEAGQKYGSTFTPSTENPSAIAEGLKTAGNIPKSAWNFVKGAVDLINPVSTFNKVKQAVGEFKDLAAYHKELGIGGAGSAAKAVFGELPRAAYETLVPEAGRGLVRAGKGAFTGNEQDITEGLETAQRAITADPVGQIAPFLIAGRAVAGKAGFGTQFDTAVSKVAAPVTRTAGAVAGGAKSFVGGGTKFAVGQATGLQPETITQITKTPGAFTKPAMSQIERGSLGREVQSSLSRKADVLAETGEAYAPVREGPGIVKVAPTWLESQIKDLTGLEATKARVGKEAVAKPLKKGELPTIQIGEAPTGKFKTTFKATGESSLRDASDVRAIQHVYDLWQPVFEKGKMTANEFLNFRADMAKLSKFERQIGKSQPIEGVTKIARGRFNEAYRPQLEGLEKLDQEFSGQSVELRRLSKNLVDREGNLTEAAINRIANATGKGKDILLDRLEETVPGITQKIKVLKAVEDVQHASGIKVGTYGRAAITGGAFFLGGPLQAIVTAVLTSPELAVPLLRRYGLIKNSSAVTAVVKALREGGSAVNQLPNKPPAVLQKEVKDIKVPMGLSIEDVSRGKPGAFAPKVHKQLEPLAAEIKKYRTPEEFLPKGIKLEDIKDAQAFGSSIRGGKYKDIDLALFLDDNHPIFKKHNTDILPGQWKKGKIEIHAYSMSNADMFFNEFARYDKETGGHMRGDTPITRKVDLEKLFPRTNFWR